MKKTELVEKNLVSQVIAERNALAITKSPFCVNLLYCLQTNNNVFLVKESGLYNVPINLEFFTMFTKIPFHFFYILHIYF